MSALARAGRMASARTTTRSRIRALRDDGLARNSFAIMATTLANGAFGYGFWILSARTFSPETVGALSAVVSAAMLAATFSDLGLRTTLMQELPVSRDPRMWSARVSSALTVGGATAIVAGAVACLVVSSISLPARDTLTGAWPLAVIAFTTAQTLNTMIDGISTAERRGEQILVRSIIIGGSKLALMVALVQAFDAPRRSILLATTAASLLGLGYASTVQLRRLVPRWRFVVGHIRESHTAVEGAWLKHYVLNLGGWLPGFVLPLEVIARLSPADNAYFTFTWMLGSLFFMVSPSISSALFVQGRWAPEALVATTARAVKLIALLLAPIALVFVLFGHRMLSLFGSNYSHFGYPLLLVLVASAVPDAITNLRLAHLRAVGRLTEGAQLNAAMAALALVLAWVLLPHLGIVGAGWAWLMAQSAGSVWTFLRPVNAKVAL